MGVREGARRFLHAEVLRHGGHSPRRASERAPPSLHGHVVTIYVYRQNQSWPCNRLLWQRGAWTCDKAPPSLHGHVLCQSMFTDRINRCRAIFFSGSAAYGRPRGRPALFARGGAEAWRIQPPAYGRPRERPALFRHAETPRHGGHAMGSQLHNL